MQLHLKMFRLILLLSCVAVIEAQSSNKTYCENFDATFCMKKIIGSWHVVAIIPEKMFPEMQEQVTCHKVEFSETDVAGFRWLVNKTFDSPLQNEFVNRINGTIVRQRYHSVPPFDVWSKSLSGVNGCFQQVLALDTVKSDISKAMIHDAVMQLHLLYIYGNSQPFLLQMLWGKMISVVIYSKKQEVTEDQLIPVTELMTKLRGPQMKPRICDRSLKDLLGLRN